MTLYDGGRDHRPPPASCLEDRLDARLAIPDPAVRRRIDIAANVRRLRQRHHARVGYDAGGIEQRLAPPPCGRSPSGARTHRAPTPPPPPRPDSVATPASEAAINDRIEQAPTDRRRAGDRRRASCRRSRVTPPSFGATIFTTAFIVRRGARQLGDQLRVGAVGHEAPDHAAFQRSASPASGC